jgi:hypothetical protein
MKAARTSVEATAVTSRTRRSRFQRLRCGIEEYLFIRHERSGSSFFIAKTGRECENRKNGLRYTVRIVWKPPTRVNRQPRPASVRLYAALSVTAGPGRRPGVAAVDAETVFCVDGDPLVYGGLAKNLLLTAAMPSPRPAAKSTPTLIRLPGYPLFLALCFRLFGMENYVAAAWVQIALDLAGCLLLADFAGRMPVLARQIAPVSLRSGIRFQIRAGCTLWLAALCPFTATLRRPVAAHRVAHRR